MKLTVISKGLKSRQVPRPLQWSLIWRDIRFLGMFLFNGIIAVDHDDFPQWGEAVLSPSVNVTFPGLARMTSRTATPLGDPRGVPKRYKRSTRYRSTQSSSWKRIRLTWKIVKVFLSGVKTTKRKRQIVSAFKGLIMASSEFGNIDFQHMLQQELSDIDTTLSDEFLTSLLNNEEDALCQATSDTDDGSKRFNQEWDRFIEPSVSDIESAMLDSHQGSSEPTKSQLDVTIIEKSQVLSVPETMFQEPSDMNNTVTQKHNVDTNINLPLGTEIKYWAFSPGTGSASPSNSENPSDVSITAPTLITLPVANNGYNFPSTNINNEAYNPPSLRLLPQTNANEIPANQSFSQQNLYVSNLPETSSSTSFKSTFRPSGGDIIYDPLTVLVNTDKSADTQLSFFIPETSSDPSTSPISSTWSQLADEECSDPPKKKRKYGNYRKMRDDNNRACARYRASKKEADSKLVDELRMLQDKNKELVKKRDKVVQELTHYNFLVLNMHTSSNKI